MTTTSNHQDILELITRRQRQLMVHSFLYYELNESIIDDTSFDHWCRELVKLQRDYLEIAKKAPYWNPCKQFDETGSGFFIKKYPDEIITVAMHMLYRYKNTTEPFDQFVHRLGLRLLGGD